MASQKIHVTSLAFVHYQHPDLEKALEFLKDFGLVEVHRNSSKIYLRGYGNQPYLYVAEKSPDGEKHFVGGYYNVTDLKELEKATKHPTASSIEDNDGPGGGKSVRIVDPHGFVVGFVYTSSTGASAPAKRLRLELSADNPISNTATKKLRQGDTRRFEKAASPVHKLGHYGIIVPREHYESTLAWYFSTLNLAATDVIFSPETLKETTSFNHIDLGAQYTDHHSFFIGAGAEGSPAHVHHCSFEVNDYDTQVLGHDWLRRKGWTNCWGIGRHILGSQIFDYWFDASGNIVEHYSDGDMVNQDTRFEKLPGGPDSLYIWGPDLPLAFISGKLADAGKLLVAPPNAFDSKPAQYTDSGSQPGQEGKV